MATVAPGVLGVFAHVDTTVRAIRELRAGGFQRIAAYSPVPLEEIEEALTGHGLPRSPVRLFTLVSGLIGGLVVIETLFHYQGIGGLIFTAANKKDFPVLQAGVMTVGVIFTVASLAADLLYAALNPRIRAGGET